jgi:phosphoserine phosphatase RsbU/P
MNTVSTSRLAELRFAARAEHLQELRAAVRTAAQQCGCTPTLTEQLTLAVNEAAMNIIQHAYRNAPAGEIILEIHNNGAELVFRLLDFAAPVDRDALQPRDLDKLRPGGLGLHLIRTVMDAVEYLPPPPGVGNLLQLRKRIA